MSSSGTAYAQDRRGLKKTAATAWFKPPPSTPLYAAVPRPAPLHEDALASFQSRLYAYLTDPRRGAKQNDDKSWTFNNAPPYEKIAKDLGVSKSTVWRALKLPDSGLIAKQSVQVFAVYSREGGKRRIGTHYYMPPFAVVLRNRRALPDIILTKSGHPIVIGRRRRFVTREVAAAWAINPEAVQSSSRQTQRPLASSEAVLLPASGEARPAAPAKGPPRDLSPICEVLLEFCHRGDESDCQLVFNAVQGGEPEPSVENVAEIAFAACKDRRRLHPDKPITPKFVADMVQARVKDWRERQRKATRDAERRGPWERDQRINSLVSIIQQLSQPLLVQTDADRRFMGDESTFRADLEAQFRTADPGEVAAARALLAKMNARTA